MAPNFSDGANPVMSPLSAALRVRSTRAMLSLDSSSSTLRPSFASNACRAAMKVSPTAATS